MFFIRIVKKSLSSGYAWAHLNDKAAHQQVKKPKEKNFFFDLHRFDVRIFSGWNDLVLF